MYRALTGVVMAVIGLLLVIDVTHEPETQARPDRGETVSHDRER